ncbi:MAG: hypothetical protein M1485_03320 [Chloroflexi bacterium]|nr:hypothetical protein [Chloroflexota bacterium]
MFQITHLISTLFSIASAAIYGYVAARLHQRTISDPAARLAWQLFGLWWYSLAATTLVGGILHLLGAFNLVSLPFFVALTYINILLICIALWGLLYYLVYLFTGSQRFLVPLTVFYILYYVLLVYYITVSDPIGVEIARWTTQLVYTHPLTGPFFALAPSCSCSRRFWLRWRISRFFSACARRHSVIVFCSSRGASFFGSAARLWPRWQVCPAKIGGRSSAA